MSLGQSLNSTHLFRDTQAALSLASELDTKCAICQEAVPQQEIACRNGHSFCVPCLFDYRASFENVKSQEPDDSNPPCPKCRVEMLDHDKQVPDLGKRLACTLPALLEAALVELDEARAHARLVCLQQEAEGPVFNAEQEAEQELVNDLRKRRLEDVNRYHMERDTQRARSAYHFAVCRRRVQQQPPPQAD